MKLVPVNNITSISSSAEDAEYIDDNVLTVFPDQVWKSTGTSGTLTARVSPNGNTVCVYNHNADTVTITIKTVGGSVIEGPTQYDYTAYEYGLDCLWHEYTTTLTYPHDVEIVFADGRSNPVYAGVVFAGTRIEFNNPDEGMQMSYVPYSQKYVMSCGTTKHVLKSLKKFYFIQAPQSRSLMEYLWAIVKNDLCDNPVPWLIRDEDHRKCNIYGYMPNYGTLSHIYPEDSVYNIEIMER